MRGASEGARDRSGRSGSDTGYRRRHGDGDGFVPPFVRLRIVGEELMNKDLAIIGASQLVTLTGPSRPRIGAEMRELAILDDGAMLIREGRIVQTGARTEIEKLIDADCEIVDAAGRVIMPGFVDAHTHPVFA